jgi:hypothetical protein
MSNVKIVTIDTTGQRKELSSSDLLTIPVISSAPAGNPPAGHVYLYALDSDNHFYQKDDAGVIVDLGASGSGLTHQQVLRLARINN